MLVCSASLCRRHWYRNAKPCAGALVERDGVLLLVKRAVAPFEGDWDIPGGFLQEWEHPAEGARREVREETGLEIEVTSLLGILIDRYGDADYNTLNIYYRARVVGGVERPADDAATLGWFTANALPANVAFPDHELRVLELWREAVSADPKTGPDPASVVHVAAGVLR